MNAVRRPRKGKVVVLVAFALLGLLGVTAIAVDGGLGMGDRQRAQAAADASALAAANVLYSGALTNNGLDSGGAAAKAAKACATNNGFSTGVTVKIPPETGQFATKAGYAEVRIDGNQKRQFSRIFGTDDIIFHGRAVAEARWSAAKVGIMVLNPGAPGAATIVGGAHVTVLGVPFIINSSAPDAATATGGGVVTATEFDITGNPGTSGSGTFIGPIIHGPPVPDPLAYLPEPDPTKLTVQDKNGIHLSGPQKKTISPGVYTGGITVSGQATLSMNPGVYYMDGGGFSFTGQGSLNAQGVIIVNAPQKSSDVVNINGSGSINITPITTGIYQGISLWQTRSSANTMYVTGNGGSVMRGTFYTAGGTLNVTGNGSNDTIGSQYISDKLVVNGNGAFNVDWNANDTARTRIIRLVE